jgi:4-amino-4-deoxy-L-arabinose transferase-like glycosyltransferase
MEQKPLSMKEVAFVLVLFIFAFGVRLIYQKESVIDFPIRADAAEYFSVAYNWDRFAIYSTSITLNTNTPPDQDFNRPPGYPMFLYPFIIISNSLNDFVGKVTMAQALLGSCTVVLLYVMGRLALSIGWAMAAGLLTALSPHLIALDHYILSESLFTFVIVFASLLFGLYLYQKRIILILLSGCYFAFSALVKPIALLLGPFLCVCFFIIYAIKKKKELNRKSLIQPIGAFLLGFIIIYSPYFIYRNVSITEKKISISRQSFWEHFVRGSDIGLRNFIKSKIEVETKAEMSRRIHDREYGVNVLINDFLARPFSYIGWYLGGKILFMWRWDNIYQGDVYQYPMIKKGFEENFIIKLIHKMMFHLHWFIYALSIGASIFLIILLFRKPLENEHLIMFLAFLVFAYFALFLTLLMPLPRYAIPVRPFAFLLSIYGIKEIIPLTKSNWLWRKRKHG